jgi:DNA-binding NtrC family response regulator
MTKHHKANARIEGIDDGALEHLMAADWPGNVRELENVVESALALAPGPRLRVQDFSLSRGKTAIAAIVPDAGLDLSLEAYEHSAIERALEESQGDVSAAARRLGIGRSTFYRKLTRYRGR